MSVWRPNWRRADEYIGIVDWRWEFLRRNPQYHLDWRREIASFYDLKDHSIGDGNDQKFKQQYGLFFPAHPSVSGPTKWNKDALHGWPFFSEPGQTKHKAVFELEHFSVAVVVDLTQDIDAQTALIAKYYKRQQAVLVRQGKIGKLKPAKNHRSLYPLYVRALDAQEAGASTRDMAA